MVAELKEKCLYENTLVVVTAKHGQSPIDPQRYVAELKKGTSPATLLSSAGLIPFSESTLNPTGIGPTEDDISQIWLNNTGEMEQAVTILQDNLNQAGISETFMAMHSRSTTTHPVSATVSTRAHRTSSCSRM